MRLASAGAIQALAPVTEADAHLGFCNVLPGSPPGTNGLSWAQLAYNAGARVNRWEFRWDRIEPKRGQWNFAPDDADVSSSRQYTLAVDGIVDGIPQWAVAPRQPRGNGVPRGLWRPADSPKNLWASFLRGLVAHYRGIVGYWEIWNEPDLKFFWNGTDADYARLLKVAHTVIKQTEPTARVIVAGMVVPDLSFPARVLADLRGFATGANPPFDLAAWHAYGNAAAIYNNLRRFRALLGRFGFGATPIWVTEDGFPASNPQGQPRQAAYVLQTIAYAFAAGASHVLIYRASDDTTPKAWGLMAPDGAPRPGYIAFQLAARYLSHSVALVYDPSATLERFVFYESSRRVVLFWNRTSTDRGFSLLAGHDSAALVDWLGQQTTLTPSAGAWKGTALGASYNRGIDPTNAVVGGPPKLLVEDNTAPIGLSLTSFIPPVRGGRRLAVLVNGGSSPASAQISAVGDPDMRQVVDVAPDSIARVDLDMLAGQRYAGAYQIGATSDLTVVAGSDAISASDVRPAQDWYVASAPSAVNVANPQTAMVHVALTAYGRSGKVLGRGSVSLDAGASATWAPRAHSGPYALTAHADEAVIVADSSGAPLQAAANPTSAWYVLHPSNSPLTLFNPSQSAVQISARFVGAPTVKAEELRLAPLHSYVLGAYGAKAVTLEASGGTVVSYRTPNSAPPPQTGALTTTGLAAAGVDTHVDLFNPGAQAAHVTLGVLTPKGTTTIARTVTPLQLASVVARKAGGPPSGILLKSDAPVVAVTGP
jgi:hypothetical protein